MTAPSLLLALSLASQLGAAPADAEAIAPADCFARSGFADPASVIDLRDAPRGGHWWIPRAREVGGALSFLEPARLALRRADGSRLEPLTVRATASALAVEVPASAAPGEVFALLEDSAVVEGGALRVSVEEPAAVSFELVSVEIRDPVPAECEAFCHEPTFLVPSVPVLAISYRGGPAVLDAWGLLAESTPFDDQPRHTDSRRLEAAVEDATVEVVLGEAAFPFTPIDVHVRVRDIATLDALASDTRSLGELPQVPMPEEEGLEPCAFGGGDRGVVSGCGFTPIPLAALALPLFALRLRRRRSSTRP